MMKHSTKFFSNHTKCITEIGYQADKAGPKAPVVREYSKLGYCRKQEELSCSGLLPLSSTTLC